MNQRSVMQFVASLSCIVGLLALLMLWDPRDPSLMLKSILDSGHAPLFALVAIAFSRSLSFIRPDLSTPRLLALSLVATIAVAGAAEAIQIPGARDADVLDLARGAAGAIAGAFVIHAESRRTRGVMTGFELAGTIAMVTFILAAAATPTIDLALAYRQREAAFPVIARFGADWERHFVITRDARLVSSEPPAAWAQVGDSRVTRVALFPAQHPGVAIREPHPDWSGYARLVIDAYNPGPDVLELIVRIDDDDARDSYLDRFERVVQLPPRTTAVSIDLVDVAHGPRDRTLDLGHVRLLVLHAGAPTDTLHFYLDSIYLE